MIIKACRFKAAIVARELLKSVEELIYVPLGFYGRKPVKLTRYNTKNSIISRLRDESRGPVVEIFIVLIPR